jgi:hypothetical protein
MKAFTPDMMDQSEIETMIKANCDNYGEPYPSQEVMDEQYELYTGEFKELNHIN